MNNLKNKTILLIISGGIAAYKSLDLIREIKRAGASVRCILTKGGANFVTPLSVSALSGEKCYTDLWDLTDESEMGHIRLSRESDLILVAPATANIMAKMAHGITDNLATTCLLATNKPVIIAPAMNPCMWDNTATQDNLKTLKSRDVSVIEPCAGDMACGETGIGRMAEPHDIIQYLDSFLTSDKPLSGHHAIVTSGPTFEPIDPVRFIGNKSSGKQGHAVASALKNAGAAVTYITGPTALPSIDGIKTVTIETANEMMDAVESAMPAAIAVCAAAVADYGVEKHTSKQKKRDGELNIQFTDNPDILKTISNHTQRPKIVIGFAAETDSLILNAQEKLQSKSCDMIVANAVGGDINPVFGSDTTSITMITKTDQNSYENILKSDVADLITSHIIQSLESSQKEKAA